MIEWILSGVARLMTWLWSSAVTLYYLAGFFVVVGGFLIFLGSIAHHYWKQSLEQRAVASNDRPNVNRARQEPGFDRRDDGVPTPKSAGGTQLDALPPGDDEDEPRSGSPP